MERGREQDRSGSFEIVAGALGPLLGGLLAAGLVALTLTVAVALGMQDQRMIAAVEPTATRVMPSPTAATTAVPQSSPTSEPLPSPTSEPLPSLTPEPPIATPTEPPTDTATPQTVPTLTATPMARSLPRIYPSPTSRPAYVAPSVTCRKETRWPVHIVRRGDTLYSLALATGTSVERLKQANCLVGDRIVVGATLYVPRPLPVSPVAPKIRYFTGEPSGQIVIGQCVLVRWSVTGTVTKLTLNANSTVLWSGATLTGYREHCPGKAGSVTYGLAAVGPGGTTQASWSITVVEQATAEPTETSTSVPEPTDETSTPEGPTSVPTTVTVVPTEPTTATPSDTSVPPVTTVVPPESTPLPPTNTPLPPTATPLPPTSTQVPPPPSATPVPPPATQVPPPPATQVPPPSATQVPPPPATQVPPPPATSEN